MSANKQFTTHVRVGATMVEVDWDIWKLVAILNENGFETVASCSGHGYRPGSIILKDGREILIMPVPEARKLDYLWPNIQGHKVLTEKE